MIVREALPEDMATVRQLCRDYRAVLQSRAAGRSDIVEAYYADAAFEDLLTRLPNLHAAPDGAIFAAISANFVVGCGMTHRIDKETIEIKRIFVAPEARGTGAAKAIIGAAIAHAQNVGYRRMVLDTVVWLSEAIGLYTKLGFEPVPPFYEVEPKYRDDILFFGRAI